MPNAVIYTRISNDDHDDRLGVDRQERLCRQLAKNARLTVTSVLVDNDLSAFQSKKRPAFEELVELLKAGEVDALVVYHADRLYRRATDLERLVTIVEATGATVHTVAAGDIDLATASGRMIARMLGAAAQGESERMSERIKAKMDELAAAGKPPGGRPPFGYSGSDYAVNPDEAKVVHLIARRILEGCSLRAVCRELDATTGRKWYPSTVRDIALNPAMCGLRVHRGEIAGSGTWDPIIDRETWEQVRAVLADPARRRQHPRRSYLLAGLVEGCAGDRMHGRPDRGGGGRTNRRTYATRSPAKRSLEVDADDLEAAVVEMLFTATDESVLPTAPVDGDKGAAEVVALEAELAELATLRGQGTISMQEWMAARAPLQERLDAAKVGARTTRRPAKLERLLAEPGAIRKAWTTLDVAAKRAIVETIIEKVIVGPATRARWTTIEERLDPALGYGIVWKV